MRLDHIAIAVPDLKHAVERFRRDLGIQCSQAESVESAETCVAFTEASTVRIELIHPLEGKGPVAKYLARAGGGLHHVCFATQQLDEDIRVLRSKGYEFLSNTPQRGAHGRRIIFIHPRCFDGVLIELSELSNE